MPKNEEKPAKLTHIDEMGHAHMVDISAKNTTPRYAMAQGTIEMSKETLDSIVEGRIAKGDVFAVARIAAIMGVKRTHDLIPLCHPLPIHSVDIDFLIDREKPAIRVTSKIALSAKTGAEMEALTAVSLACLTLYDMIKGVEKEAVITHIYLLEKSGGKSGHWVRNY